MFQKSYMKEVENAFSCNHLVMLDNEWKVDTRSEVILVGSADNPYSIVLELRID